jgi:hypothetical protein
MRWADANDVLVVPLTVGVVSFSAIFADAARAAARGGMLRVERVENRQAMGQEVSI